MLFQSFLRFLMLFRCFSQQMNGFFRRIAVLNAFFKVFPMLFLNFSTVFAIASGLFLVSWNGCTYEYSPLFSLCGGLLGGSLRKCFVLGRRFFLFFFRQSLIWLSKYTSNFASLIRLTPSVFFTF